MTCTSPTTSPLARRTRGSVRVLLVALGLAGLSSASALEPIKRYASLALNDGRTLLEVEVVNQTMIDVLVRHSGGATTLRSDLLPTAVAAELHMSAYAPEIPAQLDPTFLALANKVAVASPATGQLTTAKLPANPDAPAIAPNAMAITAITPAGEGNFVEAVSLAAAQPALAATPSAGSTHHADLAGRVALTLPGGELVLPPNVEVRAYPAALLALHLEKARARANEAAAKILVQATHAAAEGRVADADDFNVRASRTADQFLDYLPLAPYSARSDAHGHFTLTHDLRDLSLVATARIAGPNGEWTFRWIGVTPDKDALLTEANATTVAQPEPERPRFAAR